MSAIYAGDEPVLPPGFRWDRPWQGAMGPPSVLFFEGEEVARLGQRLTGEWYVLLERQRPAPPGKPFAPFVQRDRSSFDQGRRGTVMWAVRHEARIRAEVATRRLRS
ncbi:hypothetical protein CFBP498_19040 [Xanthomonas hortorum pv. vitians]|uniref:Uncharacterized protein n=1 Tax=Xanthomonas hortorum pv. vitians TaxID=83224 RepID=A0A6V7D0W4_9XANT|nr:hypothetical protein CFBP498_19040 [Xanthomonas hortorum pv. vitians]CAD0326243.1 hypothetical protein CFBP498_19040 [Xanthomonas hortorum pv. vitians]